jgi:hypothetical protein
MEKKTMVTLVMATEQALLIARPGSKWVVEAYLQGKSPQSLAVDPQNPKPKSLA